MLFSDLQNIPMAKFPVPNIGHDLIEAEANGLFDELPGGRALAALELLRHDEVSLPQAAALIGIPTLALVHLLTRLPIAEFGQIAHQAGITDAQ